MDEVEGKLLGRVIDLLEEQNELLKILCKQKKAKPKVKWPTEESWVSYRVCFWERYEVLPARNATMNAQMVNFIKRVDPKDAPHIIKYFFSCDDVYYIRTKHSIGTLLANAEKLKAEWRICRNRTGKDTPKGSLFDIKFAREVYDGLQDLGETPPLAPSGLRD